MDWKTKVEALTEQERAVLRMAAAGLSSEQIAEKLFRSIKTVEWHVIHLHRKLGSKNRAQLARIAVAAGPAPVEFDPREWERNGVA